jgi:ABC-type multidrug transport system ATPase subunit
MSGLEYPSSGKCIINGYDIVREKDFAQRSMGLCPQFDTLIDRMTVRENLRFFANIKGVPSDKVKAVCDAYLDALDIKKYQHKLIMRLSGGNRRKLSLAVALIGCPPTLYLDEPSTGLDPVASRHMWRLLQKVSQAKQSAIVLTTHNMMECEAVCHRITIMRQGEFSCIGNSQHLRTKHGAGFMLEFVVSSNDFVEKTKIFVATAFVGAVLVDHHQTMLNYEVPRGCIESLSDVFRTLEAGKVSCGIVDYTLSQSSLEQVFLKTIRPLEADGILIDEDNKRSKLADPTTGDYVIGFLSFFFALFIPGLHHFVLGNTWRGLLYLFTFNELYTGWVLDLFEVHILIKKSVQEYGHLNCWLCSCCYNIWTCCSCYCCRKIFCWWSESMRVKPAKNNNDNSGEQQINR